MLQNREAGIREGVHLLSILSGESEILREKKEAEGILLRGGVIFKGVLINDGGRPKLNYFRSYVVSLGVFLFY